MRVTSIAGVDGVTTLHVEGRLTSQNVEELRMACEAVFTRQVSLALDVAALQFVDPAGIARLHALEDHGVTIGGCSPFIAELLRDREQGGAGRASDLGDEAELRERLHRGDAQAFELLVRRHAGRMLAIARRLVGSEDDARDLVQEAFLAAFRAIDTFAGAARLSTWLHRIVVDAALMRLRSRRRRHEESIDDLLPHFDDDGGWAGHSCESATTEPFGAACASRPSQTTP